MGLQGNVSDFVVQILPLQLTFWQVFNTGIFKAKIAFTEPTNVSWIEDDGTEIQLGQMQLDTLFANHKRAVINDTGITFSIVDQAAFGRFSEKLITSQNFTWRLISHNLKVQALKFPVAKGITFDKQVTINGRRCSWFLSFEMLIIHTCSGFNNFQGNVTLQDFQLPSDNPAGGINFVAVTGLNNTR